MTRPDSPDPAGTWLRIGTAKHHVTLRGWRATAAAVALLTLVFCAICAIDGLIIWSGRWFGR